jgi:hypothetical protein
MLWFRFPRIFRLSVVISAVFCCPLAFSGQQAPQAEPEADTEAIKMLEDGDRLAAEHKSASTHQAIEKYLLALSRSEAARDFKGQFRSLMALGRAHEFLNEDEKALEYYRLGLAISSRTRGSDQMTAGNNIAALHAARGDNTLALAYGRRVLLR